MSRYQKHKEAVKIIDGIIREPGKYLIIHYSCESFYDKDDGRTPRITSIAVQLFQTGQTRSFSIHKNAELKRASVDDIEKQYDVFEKEMLEEFYAFVEAHKECYWLHWNMRDENYGFYAIERRYQVLKGKPYVILDDRKIDISRLFKDLYGDKYIDDPNMTKLIEKNELGHPDFLSGAQEAEAFENKQYIKLHKSTLRKVGFFAKFIVMANDKTLKTNATWRDIYGITVQGVFEMLREKWWFTLMTFLLGIVLGALVGKVFQ